MNDYKCRTDSSDYHDPDDVMTTEQETALQSKKEQRRTEFYDIFVHGTEEEADEIAETLLEEDPELRRGVLRFISNAIADKYAYGIIAKSANKAAEEYMNSRIESGSDTWSNE